MTDTESAVTFTNNLLSVIRQQRHLATRVIIATQEPTISPKLLNLCSTTIVHRFTSPEWFRTLEAHLAGAKGLDDRNERRGVEKIFQDIVNLRTGEALVFCPSAMVNVDEDGEEGMKITCLGMEHLKVRIRKRLTQDGGRSIMAV
jgi:hypothetical protein